MSLPRCRKTKATIRYDLVADELENILRIEIGRYGIEKHRPIAGTGSAGALRGRSWVDNLVLGM